MAPTNTIKTPTRPNKQKTPRYQQISNVLIKQIEAGVYEAGKKIPGTRQLAKQFGVSINTILTAQSRLENLDYLRAVERSGYFVCWESQSTSSSRSLPKTASFQPAPTLVKNQKIALSLIQATQNPNLLPLGAALPAPCFFPNETLKRCTSQVIRQQQAHLNTYSFPPGNLTLRKSLSKRLLLANCEINEEDWVITQGCHEALVLALKAVTQANDIVALESPTYYGLLQAIESLQLKALEIPTDPIEGIQLDALEKACAQWPIKACVIVSHFSNPLGCCPSLEHKKNLLAILNKAKIPLIEDDVYGDLAFDGHRPTPIKAFDTQGQVLYCSSLSKTVAPGLRVGWIAPGRYLEKVTYLKFTQSLACSHLEQEILAQYLNHGNYDRHIRKLQQQLSTQVLKCRELILKEFPEKTLVSLPKGGFVLWVTLPSNIQAMKLYEQALSYKISLSPGELFTTSRKYRNSFRINCAQPWNSKLIKAIQTLGRLTKEISK